MPDLGKVARFGARRMFKLASAQVGVFTLKQPGVYDPQTDTWTNDAANFTARCVLTVREVRNIDRNTVIIEQEPTLVVLGESVPEGFNPAADDTVVFDGQKYVIIRVDMVKIGETIISFILTLRN